MNNQEEKLTITALVIGDPHFTRKHFQRSQKLAEAIIKANHEHNPTMTVFLGDTLHYNIDVEAECLYLLSETIRELRGDVYHLVGNHELPNSREYLPHQNALKSLKSIPMKDYYSSFTLVEKPLIQTFWPLQAHITFIPYVPPGMFTKALGEAREDNLKRGGEEPTANLVFAHQEFIGCEMGGGVRSKDGDEVTDYTVISGHIHGMQQVGRVWYPGTPCQHHFGEEDNKALYLIEIDNTGAYKVLKRIEVDVPKFITQRVDVDGAEHLVFDNVNHHRVVIKDDATKILAFKKSQLCSRLAKVATLRYDPIRTKVVSRQTVESKSFEQLLKVYAHDANVNEELALILEGL